MKKKANKEGDDKEGEEGEEEKAVDGNNEEGENVQEDEELDSSDEEIIKMIRDSEDKVRETFDEYGISDSDIDYYDEPLIKDIMTPPIIDENSTFTWIPQLSDYIEDVKQNLLLVAKREQEELIREMEEKQENEEEENVENKDENKDESKDESKDENKDEQTENEKTEEKKEDNEEKKSDIIALDEQKGEENNLEEESKKEDEENKENEKKESEEENIKILTDEELLQQIEDSMDVSNIIDQPVLSFGVNLTKSPEEEDITSEDEEEQELQEEENEKRHEEFMNETFEILRSETPINPENINEFADYFAKGNEDSQVDLGGSKNSVHSSKDIFDEDDDENKSKEDNENEDNEKKEGEEEEEEEEKVSNAIDREQFIENLKLEIEKYERNNTKNLFLQNKLYELFRKKRVSIVNIIKYILLIFI